jgi:hypothetical protein
MAILTASEFEAVIGQVVSRIEKELVARSNAPVLESARDELSRLQRIARNGEKLKAVRPKLDSLTDAITGEIAEDHVMNQLWDILDYIDYRA